MLFTKACFRLILSPSIACFILIIVELVFGPTYFSVPPLQSPSKNELVKGLKWGSGPSNTPSHDSRGPPPSELLASLSEFSAWLQDLEEATNEHERPLEQEN